VSNNAYLSHLKIYWRHPSGAAQVRLSLFPIRYCQAIKNQGHKYRESQNKTVPMMVIITHLCFFSFWFQSCYSTQRKFLLQIRGAETGFFPFRWKSQNSYLTCGTGALQNFYERTSASQKNHETWQHHIMKSTFMKWVKIARCCKSQLHLVQKEPHAQCQKRAEVQGRCVLVN